MGPSGVGMKGGQGSLGLGAIVLYEADDPGNGASPSGQGSLNEFGTGPLG
jgi:hypothetical protein